MFTETSVGASHREALMKSLEQNSIIVDTRFNTTKTVSITLRVNRAAIRINQNVEGFKTKKENGWDYISGKTQDAYYFKILKSQGFMELKSYVEKILKGIYSNNNLSDDFVCEWYNTNVIKYLNQ